MRGKGITKEGRQVLRAACPSGLGQGALVEVAWRAVKANPHLKKCFEELKKRMHSNQAIVTLFITCWWSSGMR